ncbi:MAG: nucleotidyltransferase family protein [Candidatus Asgardarchaeia archaeon]
MSIVYYNIDLNRIVPKLKQILVKDNRVKIAIIFGSALRRREVRDIDIAIYAYPRLSLKEILLLGDRLERAIDIPIDLIPLDEVFPKLQYKILMYGLPILIRDKNLYNKLILFALGQIQDIQLKMDLYS